MPSTSPDGQDSNEVHQGDTRIWGVLSDMFIVKEMTILTVPDKIMRFTPDGVMETPDDPKKPPKTTKDLDTGTKGARTLRRTTRAALNLDKGYVIQHYFDPSRPVAASRADEYGARTGKSDDMGMNPQEMGAVGKLTDIFRVSVAPADPDPPLPAITGGSGDTDVEDKALKDAFEMRSSYNDKFGGYPGRKDLLYGRLEIRVAAHFYLNERRTGPLFFSVEEWPRDVDEDDEVTFPRGKDRTVDLNQLIVEATKISGKIFVDEDGKVVSEGTPGAKIVTAITKRLGGEILTGALSFNRTFHSWGVLVSLPASDTCNIINTDLIDATFEKDPTVKDIKVGPISEGSELHDEGVTIDERVTIFSEPKCPDIDTVGYTVPCVASALTSYIMCKEISEQRYADRWITITDRFNSMLNEIDNIYCILKAIDSKIEKIVDIDVAHLKDTEDIAKFLKDIVIPKIALAGVVDELVSHVDSIATSVKAMPDYPAGPPIVGPSYPTDSITTTPMIVVAADTSLLTSSLGFLTDICTDGDVPVPPPAPPPPDPDPPPPSPPPDAPPDPPPPPIPDSEIDA